MKKLILVLASLATLAGCATPGPGPANYGSRAYAQPADPNGWQVVSVTPVPLGTGERAGDAGVVTSSNVAVNPAPVVPGRPVYGAAPPYGQTVYGPPIYAPAPVIVQDPYWYPPVSIGLGFSFGKSWGGHRYHHRGYRRR
ncbi:hypothetical protein [Massilia sp. Leaf139]|uniref:hypothetical protein n=1 Tax=Massilia sp. Leaf139 TaxID=1736272 RepID=UPI0006FF8D36|nr:hypothetical protein [Massilia sp. Leaf139]KQQ86388.1 hypothetical protein ASF77_20655 [Massilia sp. Leaf139]